MNFSFAVALLGTLQLAIAEAGCPYTQYKLEFQSENQKILHDFLRESDRVSIHSIWTNAKENINAAPKTFLRYFKLKPEVQKLFPDFADIDPAKLPTNYVFITQTDTYAADLNSYIEQLGQNPTKCPFVAERRAKHYDADLKLIGATLIGALEEELGDRFSAKTKESWRKGLKALDMAVLKR